MIATMRARTTTWATLCCALLVTLVAAVWLHLQADTDTATAGVSRDAYTAADTPDAEPKPPRMADTGALIASVPVQPSDDPHAPGVLDLIDALDARARNGDAVAACTLGTALRTCVGRLSNLRESDEQLANRIAGLHSETHRAIEIDRAIEREADDRRWQRHCAGVDEAHRPLAMHYLLLSAQRGNPAAMAGFLCFQLSAADLVRFPELARLYHDHAPALLDAGIRAGEPMAIVLLHMNLNLGYRSTAPLSGVIPAHWQEPDLVQALHDRLLSVLEPDALSETDGVTAHPRADAIWNAHYVDSPQLALFADAGRSGTDMQGQRRSRCEAE
jgi:hypothetical protein